MARGSEATAQARPPAQRQAGPPARQTVTSLATWLGGYAEYIADALPRSVDMTPQQFIDVAMLAIRRMDADVRTKILACSQDSILFAIQEAASFGFRIGGSMAEGYLIPYGQECQFQPDYKGLLKLARRSGAFQVIEAVEVYEKDLFHVFRDPEPRIRHEPSLDPDPGPMVRVYAYAVLQNGHMVFEHMSRADIEKVRQASKAPNSPAWKNWYGQMGCKAVLKRLLKRQERSIELTRAIEADDREYQGEPQPGSATAGVAPQRGVAGLRGRLGIEEARPPSPSVVYQEADEPADDPEAGPNAAVDQERFGLGRELGDD